MAVTTGVGAGVYVTTGVVATGWVLVLVHPLNAAIRMTTAIIRTKTDERFMF
jgi:hypothetical protein